MKKNKFDFLSSEPVLNKLKRIIEGKTGVKVYYSDWYRINESLEHLTPEEFPVILIVAPAIGEFDFSVYHLIDKPEYYIAAMTLTDEKETHDIEYLQNEPLLEEMKRLLFLSVWSVYKSGMFVDKEYKLQYRPFWDELDSNLVGVIAALEFEPVEGICLDDFEKWQPEID